jgi:adenylosuccinate lyase
MLEAIRAEILLPHMNKIVQTVKTMAKQYAALPMLARTHGQAATPTTLGKELANVVMRLKQQRHQFAAVVIRGKCNGAVGNFNAHLVAYPEVNWLELSKKFVENLDLSWNAYTTQIEPHDYIAEYCDTLARFNGVLIDFAADMWGYISLGYFQQKNVAGEVGSSTMPHKINPIDFENAESNLALANTLLHHFTRYLPRSRWQRDLRDSTLLRNLGVAFAHTLIALQTLQQGLSKTSVNEARIKADLADHWEVLAEAIQTMLRRYHATAPYEQLKELTRGKVIDKNVLAAFINKLDLPAEAKQRLLNLTPLTYLGLAITQAKDIS